MSLCACIDDGPRDDKVAPPELPFEYATERLTIHSDIQRCEGDFARWESFISHAETYLGLTVSGAVELNVWETEDFDGERYCGGDWGGCYRRAGQRIYSGAATVEHELVHAVASELANRDAFFEEGLAEALSASPQFGRYAPWFPVKGSGDVDYPSAGHFVRWLLETRGPDPLLSHMSAPGGVTEFEAIYAQSLTEMTAEYFADAASSYPRLHDYPAPAFEAQGEGLWSSVIEFDCAGDDVRGAADGLEAIRELTVPKTGFYAIWSSAGGRVRGREKTGSGNAFAVVGDQIAAGPIEAGTYEVGIVGPPGVDSGVVIVWESLTARPVPPGGLP
ncbi:hypothetical protein [Enhygromyxa salina]|uniref:hypothetical protein n=1 Tax=Enhygromyxa salina TaxID=215803 RepID=UPI000D08E3D4|nr:hypothetical protein [Enhygromyxa salina]